MKKTGMKTLLDGKGVERVLSRLTHEIIEKNKGAGQIVLVGIASGGIPLSQVIRGKIRTIEGVDVPTGFVDMDAVIGKALFIYFSIDWNRGIGWTDVERYPEFVRWDRIGSVLR